MEKLRETPSQTVGPFFAYGLTAVQYSYDYTSIADDLLVDPSIGCRQDNYYGVCIRRAG